MPPDMISARLSTSRRIVYTCDTECPIRRSTSLAGRLPKR